MSVINKLTGLYTREDVEETIKFTKSEVKRLHGEVNRVKSDNVLLRIKLLKAHFRDPKTGRMLKKGAVPENTRGRR